MPSNFGGDFADTYVNSFYISDAYSAWNMAMSSVYGDSRGFSIYGSNSWETQMPPSARAFNPDTLRIMASTLYQDLYYNSDSSINNLYSTDSQYLATIDSYTTTTSRPLTNSNSEEGLYTEGSSFIEFGGSDGTTVELDRRRTCYTRKSRRSRLGRDRRTCKHELRSNACRRSVQCRRRWYDRLFGCDELGPGSRRRNG